VKRQDVQHPDGSVSISDIDRIDEDGHSWAVVRQEDHVRPEEAEVIWAEYVENERRLAGGRPALRLIQGGKARKEEG